MNALARQYHSDDHKGHWQDGLQQSSRIIRSINKTLELVREAYMVNMCALIDFILERCIPTDPGRIAPFLWGAVLLLIPYLWISKIHFWISIIHFRISKNELWISKNRFLDIHKSILGYP